METEDISSVVPLFLVYYQDLPTMFCYVRYLNTISPVYSDNHFSVNNNIYKPSVNKQNINKISFKTDSARLRDFKIVVETLLSFLVWIFKNPQNFFIKIQQFAAVCFTSVKLHFAGRNPTVEKKTGQGLE